MTVGKHLILDLYQCDTELLNDYNFLYKVMYEAIELTGAKILNHVGHEFEPQGATLLFLLSESHASIHTWPEKGYAAIDIYTCSNKCLVQNIINYLLVKLKSTSYQVKELDRSTVKNNAN